MELFPGICKIRSTHFRSITYTKARVCARLSSLTAGASPLCRTEPPPSPSLCLCSSLHPYLHTHSPPSLSLLERTSRDNIPTFSFFAAAERNVKLHAGSSLLLSFPARRTETPIKVGAALALPSFIFKCWRGTSSLVDTLCKVHGMPR